MAKIGLAKPRYSKVTLSRDESGKEIETYGPGKMFSMAVDLTTSLNMAKTKLHADNGVARMVSEFIDGSISFTADELEREVEADITGADLDQETGKLTNREDDAEQYIRFGVTVTRMNRQNKKQYCAVIFPRVMFDIPADDYETKGESIAFKTTTLTGEILRNVDGEWRIKSKWYETKAEAEAFLDENIAPKAA